MTLKQKIFAELETVDPVQLHLIYELIINLQNKTKPKLSASDAHLKVRKALQSINGSLSSEIVALREDRI